MLMMIPVSGMDVDLDVSYPLVTAYTDTRVAVIRSRIPVVRAYRENLDGFAIGGLLRKSRPETMFPDIMQEDLRHGISS